MSTNQAIPSLATVGGADYTLSNEAVTDFVNQRLAALDIDGERVCVVVPDATRTCPLPLLFGAVHRAMYGRAASITVLVALGTHRPMSDEAIANMLGYQPGNLASTYPGVEVRNHQPTDPDQMVYLGQIPASRIQELSGWRLSEEVEVRLNRAVVDTDTVVVIGPVLPHEVVGFSGGNKYFFPGVGGQDLIDLSHWLGALITSSKIIGSLGLTPVRALIDEASALIPSRKLYLGVVTEATGTGLHSLAFGGMQAAWAAAAQVSAATHIHYMDAPVHRVLALIGTKYEDMWTGAKGFYKTEPVVADGGEVIVYAPHITQFSEMHPEIVDIGFHCRDYFVAKWEHYKDYHWGALAHSTHVRGAGTYSETEGERLRVTVTIATGIPRETVERAGLAYRDPATVDIATFEVDPDTLVVHDAGETLYRLRS